MKLGGNNNEGAVYICVDIVKFLIIMCALKVVLKIFGANYKNRGFPR